MHTYISCIHVLWHICMYMYTYIFWKFAYLHTCILIYLHTGILSYLHTCKLACTSILVHFPTCTNIIIYTFIICVLASIQPSTMDKVTIWDWARNILLLPQPIFNTNRQYQYKYQTSDQAMQITTIHQSLCTINFNKWY